MLQYLIRSADVAIVADAVFASPAPAASPIRNGDEHLIVDEVNVADIIQSFPVFIFGMEV